MIGLLLALYPARWRRRYGDEFRAVLESRPLGPFDVADVVLGALDARLALRISETSSANGGHLTMLRIGGLGAIAGGSLWVVGMAGGSFSGELGGLPWGVLIAIGTIGILLALAGLSAFQAHRSPRLAWAAFGIPAIGTLISLFGLVGMAITADEPFIGSWSGWGVWFLGVVTTLVGSGLFAIATVRANVLSRGAATALAIASIAAIVVVAATSGTENADIAGPLVGGTIIAFGGGWVALGVSALRRGPIRAVAPA